MSVVDDVGRTLRGTAALRLLRHNDRACAHIRSFQHDGARLSAADDVAYS
jgi:hypothetical protein